MRIWGHHCIIPHANFHACSHKSYESKSSNNLTISLYENIYHTVNTVACIHGSSVQRPIFLRNTDLKQVYLQHKILHAIAKSIQDTEKKKFSIILRILYMALLE